MVCACFHYPLSGLKEEVMTNGTSLERAFYLAKSAVHVGQGMFTRLQDSKPLLFLVKDLIAIFVFPDFEVRSRNFDTLHFILHLLAATCLRLLEAPFATHLSADSASSYFMPLGLPC